MPKIMKNGIEYGGGGRNENTTDATLNTTNFNSGGVQYKIKDGYCTVSVAQLSPKNTGTSKVVATGLPESKYLTTIVSTCIKADGGVNGCIYINRNSNTLYAHVLSTTENMWGSLVYPIE